MKNNPVIPRILFRSVLLLFSMLLSETVTAQKIDAERQAWFLEKIGVPQHLEMNADKPIVIAIVDDGVRSTHIDLHDFIWTNKAEIPHNRIDDDGNGYVDDQQGWDTADNDNNSTPMNGYIPFYHGTHLAGIIAQIARRAYGNAAPQQIKLMIVKSIKDTAQSGYLKQAYQGIDYAVNAGADIILCAWGSSVINSQEERILQKAQAKGILVISSAGNFPQDQKQYPAAIPYVMAVTSLDGNGSKTPSSNFGSFVDIAALGETIQAAGIESDTAYQTRSGTSQAAAVVAATAALIKAKHPLYSTDEIKACLLSTTQPIKNIAAHEQAKLGTGKLNIEGAINCELLTTESIKNKILDHPKGYLRLTSKNSKIKEWLIKPTGDIKGIRFKAINKKDNNTGTLTFYAGSDNKSTPIAKYALADLPETTYVPAASAFVQYQGANAKKDLLLAYESELIDWRTKYCHGTKRLSTEGVISDGSGSTPYAYNSDCKWQITAPPGKVVKFELSQLDTESRRDMIYLFNGTGTHEQIMAIYSGKKLPPQLVSWSNQVLVWFVSDQQNQGQGWQAKYHFIDAPKRQ